MFVEKVYRLLTINRWEYFLQIFYFSSPKIQAGLQKPTVNTLGSHFSNISNFYIPVFCWKNAF